MGEPLPSRDLEVFVDGGVDSVPIAAPQAWGGIRSGEPMGTVPCSTSQQGTAPGTINLISQVNDTATMAQEALPAPPLPPQLCVDVIKGGRKLSVIHGHALIFFPPLKIFLDRLWAKKKR